MIVHLWRTVVIVPQPCSACPAMMLDPKVDFHALNGYLMRHRVPVRDCATLQIRVGFSNRSSLQRAIVVMPTCSDYVDCLGCAGNDQCAWCASENSCVTVSDAFSKDCRGVVFDLPCPSNYVSGNCRPGCKHLQSIDMTCCLM